MTNKQINARLEKIQIAFDDLREMLEEEIEALEEIRDAIEENACDHDRNMTER